MPIREDKVLGAFTILLIGNLCKKLLYVSFATRLGDHSRVGSLKKLKF